MALGGAQFGQQYGPVSLADAANVVHTAIDAGVNLIDTSAFYGRGESERILGEVLQGGWRDRVAICTKAGRIDRAEFDFTPKAMRASLDASLQRLKTDHVEILLAHDIEYATDFEAIFTETAGVLYDLKAEGKARFIGMSCLPLGLLREAIMRCELDLVISYCHFNLQDQTLLSDLLPLAEERGVGVLNASPLGMGLLTNQGPQPWHPGHENIKAACRAAVEYCREHSADISTLGMQYCFAETRIPSTISGAATLAELHANLQALRTSPDPELLSEVQAILAPVQNQTWSSGNWPLA
jgi:L-galactose dehydrogenase